MILGGHFDITNKKARIKEIEDILNDESIWNDLEYASSLNQELSNLKKSTSKYNDLYETIKTNIDLLDILNEQDEEVKEIEELLQKIKSDCEKKEIETYLNGKYDNLPCRHAE